jgi:antitoxin HigA-1
MRHNKLMRGLRPTHPGEILREDVLPALRKSKTEIARLLGISRQTLHDILTEKQPITPQMALRIGKLIGNGPEIWLNMQNAYDLDLASTQLAAEIAAIPTLEAAE